MSSAVVSGKFALRMCIVNYSTPEDHMSEVLEAVEEFGREALTQP